MPKLRMTELAIQRLKPPPPPKQVDYFDTVLPGLICRLSYGGSRTWNVLFYINAKAKAVRLGRYPALDLAEARAKAREVLQLVAQGGDPKSPKPRTPDTIDSLVENFLERHVRRNCRGAKEVERHFRKEVLTRWSGRLVTEIGRRDVIELMDAIVDRGAGYSANRTFAHTRKMFAWALERGIIEVSPFTGLRKPHKEQTRDHVISDDELRVVWTALEQISAPWDSFFRILILTGQRRGEVAKMRWPDVNLEERVWTIPREHAKNGRAHRVPLTDSVIDILVNLPQFIGADGADGEYVFGADGQIPLSGFSSAKAALDRAVADLVDSGECLKVKPWRIHDLRRTAATGIARLGTPPYLLSTILNHAPATSLGITSIYLRHSYDDEKRTALETWARHVSLLTTGTVDNVIPFVRR